MLRLQWRIPAILELPVIIGISKMRVLRPFTLLVIASLAVAASAQVTYSFSGTSVSAINPLSFTLTTSTFVVSNTTFSSFDASSNVASVLFDLVGDALTPAPNLTIASLEGPTFTFYFPTGAFSTVGTHTDPGRFNTGTLTVQTVPEPASIAALGLGAAALLRRRRKP
ncbi:PEP-CTERM sorting domain-containing protein [bacterium]|nr:MAG: PEP-CTERM sorting domain-containing protein [bacterium]